MTFQTYLDACDYYRQYRPGWQTNQNHGGQRENPGALRQFVDHKILVGEIQIATGFVPLPIEGHHYCER